MRFNGVGRRERYLSKEVGEIIFISNVPVGSKVAFWRLKISSQKLKREKKREKKYLISSFIQRRNKTKCLQRNEGYLLCIFQ